jgi:hypothetical protein
MSSSESTQIDHGEYPLRIMSASAAALRYTISDAQQAISACPNGHKAGYYADEVHYCAMELKHRTLIAS